MRYHVPCFILYSCLGLLFFSCQSPVEEASPRPNIIFIMSDDHAYQAISAYDDRLIQTPNIDRIAQMGMLFTNASVTNSICAPSRATILTGKHSHINGKTDNHFPFDTTNVTFPQLLQDAGYQTAMFGKLHFGNNPKGFVNSKAFNKLMNSLVLGASKLKFSKTLMLLSLIF
jgi:arylsulfatase A-like enzyme